MSSLPCIYHFRSSTLSKQSIYPGRLAFLSLSHHPSASGSCVPHFIRRIAHYLPHSISSLVCSILGTLFFTCPANSSLVLRAARCENAISPANENFWLPSRHNCFHHFLPHRTFHCFLYLVRLTQNSLYSRH